MVLVLAKHELEQRRIARILFPLKVVRSGPFPETSQQQGFGAVVILAPDCRVDFARNTCAEVRRLGYEGRGVLVTKFDPENACALTSIWSGGVIWVQTAELDLKKKVEELLANELQRRVFDLLCGLVDDPSGLLRQGFRASLLDLVPPLQHRELVSVVGGSEQSFRSAWRAAGLKGRSEAVIDWGLLARVISARGDGESLNKACYRIGIEAWRIQRAARRRVGIPAGELNEGRLVEALRAWIG
jgi:hypothetical protein